MRIRARGRSGNRARSRGRGEAQRHCGLRALKEGARANICCLIERLLCKHGYPNERQDQAIQLVLPQTEAWPDHRAA